MPIYEYRCNECGKKFDMLRGMADRDDDVICPKCGANKPKRMITSAFSRTGEGGSGGEVRMPT
jgi:putative FmdB family regulatory protein